MQLAWRRGLRKPFKENACSYLSSHYWTGIDPEAQRRP